MVHVFEAHIPVRRGSSEALSSCPGPSAAAAPASPSSAGPQADLHHFSCFASVACYIRGEKTLAAHVFFSPFSPLPPGSPPCCPGEASVSPPGARFLILGPCLPWEHRPPPASAPVLPWARDRGDDRTRHIFCAQKLRDCGGGRVGESYIKWYEIFNRDK